VVVAAIQPKPLRARVDIERLEPQLAGAHPLRTGLEDGVAGGEVAQLGS
jgi:hypothetical protein